MNSNDTMKSRRAFLTSGGAMLGAGVAAAASAAPARAPATASAAEDREALRELHLAFRAHVEQQRYGAAAALFADGARLELGSIQATGREAIHEQLARQHAATTHTAWRQGSAQRSDRYTVSEDRRRATATFHIETEISTLMDVDCTFGEMARLQGCTTDRRWEHGRIDAEYANTGGQWRIASLRYRAV
jgi:hypothetical protein